MERIYRTYRDTEVIEIAVNIKCPHCGKEWLEDGKTNCGEIYQLECEAEENGCGKSFEMYFDAS